MEYIVYAFIAYVNQLTLIWSKILNMYGQRIKELRTEKGLTQKQLAEVLNSTQKNVSKYELELLDLSTDLIIRICKFFDVSADYLLGLED